jgi:hypothetical protein
MDPELLASSMLATALWAGVAVGVIWAPRHAPAEVWVSNSSEKVRSHPTLVRAAAPANVATTVAKGWTRVQQSLLAR